MIKLPFSHAVIRSILAFILASGGTYGGYKVVKDYDKYGTDFETRMHTVRSVIDGDTVKIEKWIKIRLLGIDAPEKGDCYYKESKEFLNQLVDDTDIILEKDISGKDRYGRLLRYIFIPQSNPEEDEVFVNLVVVEQGYAFNSKVAPDKRYRDLLSTAAAKARKEGRGLWSACPELVEAQTKDAKRMRENDSQPPSKSCTIKGNISEKGYGRMYFMEGCPNYGKIKIDLKKGENWFCSESEANEAGFTKSESCNNTF